MVGKINYRPQFAPVLGYAFQAKKDPEIVASSLCGVTLTAILSEFEGLAGRNTRCLNPCAHFILSPAEGEILTRQQWEEICEATAKKFNAVQEVPHGG
jgi:hypothetical protein